MSSFGTPAQQKLHSKFFVPFFHWQDDAKLREWLREQDPDELEQYLAWFDWTNHRDREILGHQELRKLRNGAANMSNASRGTETSMDFRVWGLEKAGEVITLKPEYGA